MSEEEFGYGPDEAMDEGSFMDGIDVTDARELETKPTGSEVVLTIMSAESRKSAKGNLYLFIRLEIADEPLTRDINHMVMLPAENATPKQNNMRKLEMKRFGEAFEIDFTQRQNLNEWIGLTAFAILKEEVDEVYGKQNKVKSWVAGS